MGKVKENLLTKGFSGKIGDEIVFRQVGNRTLFAKRPRKTTLLSPAQEAQRNLFGKAVLFAKTMLLNPDVRVDYQNRARLAGLASAFSAAVTDYLKNPTLTLIDTDYYKGVAGDVIWIIALDDFKIQKVTVTLKKPDGTLLETGEAVLESGRWKYITTAAIASTVGVTINAIAVDRPGKTATLEKQL